MRICCPAPEDFFLEKGESSSMRSRSFSSSVVDESDFEEEEEPFWLTIKIITRVI